MKITNLDALSLEAVMARVSLRDLRDVMTLGSAELTRAARAAWPHVALARAKAQELAACPRLPEYMETSLGAPWEGASGRWWKALHARLVAALGRWGPHAPEVETIFVDRFLFYPEHLQLTVRYTRALLTERRRTDIYVLPGLDQSRIHLTHSYPGWPASRSGEPATRITHQRWILLDDGRVVSRLGSQR